DGIHGHGVVLRAERRTGGPPLAGRGALDGGQRGARRRFARVDHGDARVGPRGRHAHRLAHVGAAARARARARAPRAAPGRRARRAAPAAARGGAAGGRDRVLHGRRAHRGDAGPGADGPRAHRPAPAQPAVEPGVLPGDRADRRGGPAPLRHHAGEGALLHAGHHGGGRAPVALPVAVAGGARVDRGAGRGAPHPQPGRADLLLLPPQRPRPHLVGRDPRPARGERSHLAAQRHGDCRGAAALPDHAGLGGVHAGPEV
ncbi:MAG: hypothetical protein AVDCRST_MAG68-3760, partial [uncultured Gemmatimonadetes bacterium]